MIIIVSRFMLRIFTEGMGPGDLRGGDDIGADSQISFILNNPLIYTGVLLGFMQEFLNVFTGRINYVTDFAHYSYASYFYLSWLLLLFVMFTDRNEKDMFSARAGYKAIISVIAFSTVVLFCTYMYIAFTPVGADTIEGVQGRYMLPMLFPILYILGGFKIKNNINKTAYTISVFSIMSFVSFNGVMERVIPRLG